MASNPSLSVITINFNNHAGLLKTIRSVTNQTKPDIEYIVIDGGSTDGSVDIIKENEDKIQYWVSEKDRGIYNAQNKGLNVAKGEYVLFLNSGDYFNDDTSVEYLFRNASGEDIIYGDIIFKSEEKEIARRYPDTLNFGFFVKDTLPHPCTLICRKLFTKYGLYNEGFKICADWAFFIDVICKHNATYRHVNKVIAVFLLGGLSSKPENIQLVQKEKEDYIESAYGFFYQEYGLCKGYKERIVSLQQSRFIKLISHAFPDRIKKLIFL